MTLGIVALLIIGIVVFAVVTNRKSNTTSNTTGATAPAMKSFDFDTVVVDAKGNIADRRKGQAKYFAEGLGGGVTLDMVEIPGGTFTMGSPANEAGRDSSEGRSIR